ncbi:MAG: sulfite exporter TauE/SafE family protein [Alphaproteobacteria bacterium]
MQIYLPIAEMSVDVFLLIGIGALIGFLSGMFGVGGGFLMTPLLIFIGIPPAVAVGTQSNQTVATSVAGVVAHWRRGNVDVGMGLVLLVGGLAGSGLGVLLFQALQAIGQIDLVIGITYVIFLGLVGVLMAIESIRAIVRARRPGGSPRRKLHRHVWIHGLPFKRRFRRSKLYISVIPPLGIGFLVGVLAAIMGVGGGFVMVPAMIYLLGMPTLVVVGTSLFQIIFVTANAAFLHAATNQTVDVILAGLLLIGSIGGAQIGTRVGSRLPGEQLRAMLALLVLAVAGKLLYDMVATPQSMFQVTWGGVG